MKAKEAMKTGKKTSTAICLAVVLALLTAGACSTSAPAPDDVPKSLTEEERTAEESVSETEGAATRTEDSAETLPSDGTDPESEAETEAASELESSEDEAESEDAGTKAEQGVTPTENLSEGGSAGSETAGESTAAPTEPETVAPSSDSGEIVLPIIDF